MKTDRSILGITTSSQRLRSNEELEHMERENSSDCESRLRSMMGIESSGRGGGRSESTVALSVVVAI